MTSKTIYWGKDNLKTNLETWVWREQLRSFVEKRGFLLSLRDVKNYFLLVRCFAGDYPTVELYGTLTMTHEDSLFEFSVESLITNLASRGFLCWGYETRPYTK